MHGRKTFITRHSVIKRRSDLIMHLSSRIDDLRLSCSLTQALMPLESIANLNDAITFSLTCGLRTVYLINFKNVICVHIVKCQVKFCLLLDFLCIIFRDVNKDLTPKDQDKDKDLPPKDQDKDKDLTPNDQDKDKDLLDLTPQGQEQKPHPPGPGQKQPTHPHNNKK